MIFKFPGALLLILLGVLIAPAFSAPILLADRIVVQNRHQLGASHAKRSMLDSYHGGRDAPILERDLPEYGHLAVREDSSILKARSYDDINLVSRSLDDTAGRVLYKRDDEMTMNLSRRGFFSNLKHKFQSFGSAIKSGVQTAFSAVKQTAVTAVSAVKQTAVAAVSAVKTAAVTVGQGVANVAKTVAVAVARPVQAAAAKVVSVVRKTGSYIGQGARAVAGGIRRVGAQVGGGLRTAGRAVGGGLRTAGRAVAGGVRTAANWTRRNGAAIAKIGLKAYGTYTSIGARIANFIPGVGKPISKALKGVSKVANFGSDHIHAHLSAGEAKSIGVMNKIQHPFGGVAGRVLDAVLKRDLEGASLVERDDLEGLGILERAVTQPSEALPLYSQQLSKRDAPELQYR